MGCVDALTAGSNKFSGSVDSQAAWRRDNKECVYEATVESPEHVTNVGRVYDSDYNKVWHRLCEIHEADDESLADMNSDKMGPETPLKFWEAESVGVQQITDVQGHLKENIVFWENILSAPPPVIDCIKNGYCLPLKFIPPTHFQHNHNST